MFSACNRAEHPPGNSASSDAPGGEESSVTATTNVVDGPIASGGSAKSPYTVTAVRWADTEARLWCLENDDAQQYPSDQPVCRRISVYESHDGDFEMMLEVLDKFERESNAVRQEWALRTGDDALNMAFYRMGGPPPWLQLVEILARDEHDVIMARISLEGRGLKL